MKKDTFVQLLHMLIEKGKIVDGRMVTAGEKLFILIHVLIGHSLFKTASRFQHSNKETIHKIGDAADILRAIHAWRDEMAQSMWDSYILDAIS